MTWWTDAADGRDATSLLLDLALREPGRRTGRHLLGLLRGRGPSSGPR